MIVNNYNKLINNLKQSLTEMIQTATFTAVADGITHITHNLAYDSAHDLLQVLDVSYGDILIKDTDYTENEDNISIDLVGMSINTGEKISFTMFKNCKINN